MWLRTMFPEEHKNRKKEKNLSLIQVDIFEVTRMTRE